MKKFLGFAALAAAATMLAGCAGSLVSGNAPVGEIAVRNSTTGPINAVTISRCSAMSHGSNRLSGEIQPGNGMRWRVDAGCYDVQVAYGWGTGYRWASFPGIRVPGGGRRLLTVTGQGGRPR